MRYATTIVLIIVLCSVSLSAESMNYEVADGDTLYSIARRYNTSVELLLEVNNIGAPEVLLPGTILVIPDRYVVRAGDTLYGIAQRFGTDVERLREINGLTDSRIRIGQELAVSTETRSNETNTGTDAVGNSPDTTIAVAVTGPTEPLTFSSGGSWPVAGERRRMSGKLPGFLIRADRGTPVQAIAAGRVVYAGPHSSFGNVVLIQTAQEYVYVYGGQETIAVAVGDPVDAGAVIGTVGISPSEGAAALYFSVWRENAFVDPETAPRG